MYPDEAGSEASPNSLGREHCLNPIRRGGSQESNRWVSEGVNLPLVRPVLPSFIRIKQVRQGRHELDVILEEDLEFLGEDDDGVDFLLPNPWEVVDIGHRLGQPDKTLPA